MARWLMALVASSATFGLADVLCDICITEHEVDEHDQTVETAADEDEDEEEGVELSNSSTPCTSVAYQRSPTVAQHGALEAPTFDERLAASAAAVEEEEGLSGSQDAAIAGIVTTAYLFVRGLYWLVGYFMSQPSSSEVLTSATAVSGSIKLRWSPTTHVQWWLAMLGGASAFMHYFCLLKAFEGAPSTVLLPLVQVASVSVLLGSSVVAWYRHEPWITPTHAIAYLLMFIGGILPACAGQLSKLMRREFWRQTFVSYAICSEFALGLHDLMLSATSYSSQPQVAAAPMGSAEGGALPGQTASASAVSTAPAEGGGDTADSYEFFLWSRCSFICTFSLMYLCSPTLYAELRDLLSGRIGNKFVVLSAISEGLTIVGFYLASIAYGLFYQAGIVHAAEASLSQLINLCLAYVFLRCFGIGRSSAVSSMSIKLVSFVMVTIGLFLCTLENEAQRPELRLREAATREGLRQLPGTLPSMELAGSALPGAAVSTAMSPAMGAVALGAAQRMLRRRSRRL